MKLVAFVLLMGGQGASAADVRLSEAAQMAGGTFSSGGGLTVAAELRQLDGVPHICGVWARSRQLSSYVIHKVRHLLETGVVVSGTRTIYRDFRAFRQVKPAASYAGELATCVPIGSAPAQFALRIPSKVVEKGRGTASAVQVDFREESAANPALTDTSIPQTNIFKDDPIHGANRIKVN